MTTSGTRRSSSNEGTPADVLAELVSREPIFHRSEHGSSRADFERMTVADFCEVGASGRRYSRDYVLDELERRARNPGPDVWKATDFHCRRLAQDLYLLTYTLLQNKERLTRRSTIWQHSPDGWKIVFHQGTLVEEPDPEDFDHEDRQSSELI